MKKFLVKRDLDLFFSLLEQREVLQQELENLKDNSFYSAPSERKLLLQIQHENQVMMSQFHAVFNQMKRHEDVSQAYEGLNRFAGGYINSKT